MPTAQQSSHTAPRITCGPNAGKERPINTVALDNLTRAKSVLLRLIHDGFTLKGAPRFGGLSPILPIRTCAKCNELQPAIAVKFSLDERGQFRVMEHKVDGVRVQWIERDN